MGCKELRLDISVAGFFKSSFGVVDIVARETWGRQTFVHVIFPTDATTDGGDCMVEVFDDGSGGKSDAVVVKFLVAGTVPG